MMPPRKLLAAATLAVVTAGAIAGVPDYAAAWIVPGDVPANVVYSTGRINNHGQIVGSRGIDGNQYSLPFSWTPTSGLQIGGDLPGGVKWAGAGAVNDSGMTVGFGSAATGQHALVVSPGGKVRDLAPLLPAGMKSSAGAVNASGQVLGSYMPAGNEHFDGSAVFLWSQRDGMQLLPLPPGLDSVVPTGINDDGLIVGWGCNAVLCSGFRGTVATGLALIPGGYPNAVNNSGRIVGQNEHFGPASFYSEPTGHRDLPLPSGSSSCSASDINTAGVAVGYCDGAEGGPVAWYPVGDGYVVSTLSRHIGKRPAPFPPCGGELCFYSSTADAINDAGQIVVRVAAYPYGYIDDGDLLLLTPGSADAEPLR